MICIEPSEPIGIREDVLLHCDLVTEEVLDEVRALSGSNHVAVAARSNDDSWLPAAFAAGAVGCAVGVVTIEDTLAFTAALIGYV
jgi:hypothetical protein